MDRRTDINYNWQPMRNKVATMNTVDASNNHWLVYRPYGDIKHVIGDSTSTNHVKCYTIHRKNRLPTKLMRAKSTVDLMSAE